VRCAGGIGCDCLCGLSYISPVYAGRRDCLVSDIISSGIQDIHIVVDNSLIGLFCTYL
jgi:hypothetical protein